jgi:hypothetical protein
MLRGGEGGGGIKSRVRSLLANERKLVCSGNKVLIIIDRLLIHMFYRWRVNAHHAVITVATQLISSCGLYTSRTCSRPRL